MGVSGSLVAVPVWVPIMVALHEKLPVRDFDVPEGIRNANTCDLSHLIATRWCPKIRPEHFLKESVVDTCTLHGPGRMTARVRSEFSSTRSGPPSKQTVKKKRDLIF
jgi:membrane carboxypeptidase/penicillin-binding protein